MAAAAILELRNSLHPPGTAQPLASDFLPEVRLFPAAQPPKDFLISYVDLTHQDAATPKRQEKKWLNIFSSNCKI